MFDETSNSALNFQGVVPNNYYAETLVWMHNLYIGMMHERCRIEQLRLLKNKRDKAPRRRRGREN